MKRERNGREYFPQKNTRGGWWWWWKRWKWWKLRDSSNSENSRRVAFLHGNNRIASFLPVSKRSFSNFPRHSYKLTRVATRQDKRTCRLLMVNKQTEGHGRYIKKQALSMIDRACFLYYILTQIRCRASCGYP